MKVFLLKNQISNVESINIEGNKRIIINKSDSSVSYDLEDIYIEDNPSAYVVYRTSQDKFVVRHKNGTFICSCKNEVIAKTIAESLDEMRNSFNDTSL